MRHFVTAAALLLTGVIPVSAQTSAPGQTTVPPPAISPQTGTTAPSTTAPSKMPTPEASGVTTGSTAPAAVGPTAGANSFTEAQARSRIESNGFTNLSGLKKDDTGIWRATASKDGKSQSVSLDYKGVIVAQ